jgi:hypothetical protein
LYYVNGSDSCLKAVSSNITTFKHALLCLAFTWRASLARRHLVPVAAVEVEDEEVEVADQGLTRPTHRGQIHQLRREEEVHQDASTALRTHLESIPVIIEIFRMELIPPTPIRTV